MNFFDLHTDTAIAAFDAKKSIGDFSLPLAAPPYEKYVQTLAVFLWDKYEGSHEKRLFDALSYIKADPLYGRGWTPLPSVENCGFCDVSGDFFTRLRAAGVRLCSFSWNADNPLCGGVRGDGRGLSETGRGALAECERLGITVDVSHCSDAAFDDFCRFSERPFIASHSCCRSVCPNPRNLTDAQIKEIVSRGGLIGINFYRAFLAQEGDCGVSAALRHLGRLLELGALDCAAVGSDYDGADIAPDLKTPEAFYLAAGREFGARTAEKVFYGNAARFFADKIAIKA